MNHEHENNKRPDTAPESEALSQPVPLPPHGPTLFSEVNAIPGFTCKKPAGSFYAFPNIKAFGKSSQAFAEELLKNAGVVTVPGSAFGDMGEGYLRLVFANSDENLKEAVRRLPEELRAVVVLRFFAGYTQAETARALGIPQGTAATRQRRALELLRLELGEEGDP